MPNDTRALKIKRGERICALRAGAIGIDQLVGKLTSLQDYATSCNDSQVQIESGKEPHLLMVDLLNSTSQGAKFNISLIFSVKTENSDPDGLIEIGILYGAVLLPQDTLVYWQ